MNIREIELLTVDPDGTRYFYHELLGLEIISGTKEVTKFSAGSSVLTFQKAENIHPVYHFAFNIPKNKLEEAMDFVGSKVNLIEITPANCIADFKNWNAKAFYFFDNNSNIVEMIARFDLNNDSPNKFDGSSVYAISEIGMVVENPEKYAQELMANHKLEYFPKQPPTDDFITVGNDDGLLIIVPHNRVWFPTNSRSASYPTKVTVRLNGRLIVI